MRDYYNNITPSMIIIAILIVAVLCVAIGVISGYIDNSKWNNGHHKDCGGEWVYEQAVGHQYSTSHIYYCDKCGATIEIGDRR